jgi:Fe-S cluster assembly ATP-binding protein
VLTLNINTLEIKNLSVNISEKEILKDINLSFSKGRIYAIFGPNGVGKTTLLKAIMGFQECKVKGSIKFQNKSILKLSIDKRVGLGIAMSFQYPPSIKGVTLKNMLNICLKRGVDTILTDDIKEKIEKFNLAKFLDRDINVGFSGGERKRADILQCLLLKPKILFLDEPDSGVDIPTIKIVAKELKEYSKQTGCPIVIVTHQGAMLEHIKPDKLIVMTKEKVKEFSNVTNVLKKIKEGSYDAI